MFRLVIFTILLFASNIVAAQTAIKGKVIEGDVLYIVDGQLSSKKNVDALGIENIKNVNVLSNVKKIVVVTTQNGASKSGISDSRPSMWYDSLRREYAIKLVRARFNADSVLRVSFDAEKDTTAPKRVHGTISKPLYIVSDSTGNLIIKTRNYSEIQQMQKITGDKIKVMSIIGNIVQIQLK